MSYDPVSYWDKRYREGRDSGEGSRGENAMEKARQVNLVMARYGVKSMIDWGCGDGQVLRHFNPTVQYIGVDVSRHVLSVVSEMYPERFFILNSEPGCQATKYLKADMALSMDVLFHMVKDDDYDSYLGTLFDSARKIVLVYATNYDGGRTAPHVLRRRFTPDIQAMFPDWQLADFTEREDPTQPGFYTYLRSTE